MTVAFGHMRISPAEFWHEISYRDFILARRGFFETKDAEYKTSWEQARFMAFFSVTPHTKKGALNNMKDLVMFEWEKPEQVELTEEMMDYMLRKVGNKIGKDGVGYNA